MSATSPSSNVHSNSTNLRAVEQMQLSKNDEAIATLSEGLQNLLPCLHDPSVILAQRTLQAGLKFFASVSLPENTDPNTIRDDTFMLYNRALLLSPEALALMQNNQIDGRLLATTMLYNLGLVYHLDGLRQGESSYLTLAFDLYSFAYRVLSEQSPLPPGGAVSCNLAFLSITNNVGHIHAYFLRFVCVKLCLSLLVQCLLSSFPCPVTGEPFMSDDENKTFYLNVRFIQESELLSAPAA